MGKPQLVTTTLVYIFLLSALALPCYSDQQKKVYVVYMGEKPSGQMLIASLHYSMLSTALGGSAGVKESLLYSYGRTFNGFVAELTDDQVERVSEMEGVVLVIPNRQWKLHTTRSWDFLGLPRSNVRGYAAGQGIGGDGEGDVIIGVFDTGIWPESDSFNDDGLGPPPSKWKGKCHTNNSFSCNNKIIGARYYNVGKRYYKWDLISPRDSDGHGTHTASIAAGREVDSASYFGIAGGVARGGAPNARIAVYKVCWIYSCETADLLAAFDDAIADGVDIISISIGGSGFLPPAYFEDPIAIGSFHAMRKGILTSSSAGNSGPYRGSLSNFAPWLLTVAANSIDRKFQSDLVLGNGQIVPGNGINTFNLNGTSFPLIWGGDAANYSAGYGSFDSKYCYSQTIMDSQKLKGKISLCEIITDGSVILTSQGAGTIMPSSKIHFDMAANFPLPATLINQQAMDTVIEYTQSDKNPTATIKYGETLKYPLAPMVASFSSRGPNTITPDILKPDLTAPGLNIIAAYSPIASPTEYVNDTRKVNYNILSGTSMSCPHASGAAAYIKAFHPTWSPAVIKSALMTTATIIDPEKHREDKEFAYGSGQINPAKAVDPGLVFNISEADYIELLCKQGYNDSKLRLLTGEHSHVCKSTKHGRAWDLNYPSFALAVEDGQEVNAIFTRKVTNVGIVNSTYHASIDVPDFLQVKVVPSVLSFSRIGEERSFTVEVKGPKVSEMSIVSGSITWSHGMHVVRSPLVVYTVLPPVKVLKKTHGKSTREAMVREFSLFNKYGSLEENEGV